MTQGDSLSTDGEAGWRRPFRAFVVQSVAELLTRLREFIPDTSAEQVDAGRKALPWLQEQAGGRVVIASKRQGTHRTRIHGSRLNRQRASRLVGAVQPNDCTRHDWPRRIGNSKYKGPLAHS
jgi:hypothetical protein